MKKLITLCLSLCLMAGMAVTASAADYTFSTAGATDYYGSTNYEDLYDGAYNYGGMNQIDFDIPEIKYGLAQDFLESSLQNPYLTSGTQYGLQTGGTSGSGGSAEYPNVNYGDAVVSGPGSTIEIEYQPTVTVADLTQSDGSIGIVTIKRVGLSAKVYEGATTSSMAKGAGHYASSSCWTGNVALFGHNRGSHPYFNALKNVKVGDTVTYQTNQGTRTYQVETVAHISSTDYSYLNEMGDNRITLITCIANQPSLRLCVQAVEIR